MLKFGLLLSFIYANLLSAKPQITAEQAKASVVVKNDKLKSVFHISINLPEGTKLNFDGPWKLVVSGGIDFLKGKEFTLTNKDFDKTKNYFSLKYNKKSSPSNISNYSITYFFCSKDIGWCKRSQGSGVLKI